MGSLQAGAARVDITPPLGVHMVGYFTDRIAEDIHDRLYAKAIVLSDGETRIGLVICDLIVVPDEIVDEVKAIIEHETGIPPSHVLVCGTHTHTGPAIVGALGTPQQEDYREWVPRRIADAFLLAQKRLQPAQAAHATGACGEEVHNRRYHMKDGSVKMNPGYQNPAIVRPAGPIDPQFGLLILRAPDRQPIAAMGNLSLHYVGGPGTSISADYFAAFGEALQRCAGAMFLAPLTNGTFGDVNNCDFLKPARTSPHPYYAIERVANVVAAEAWRIWNLLREEDFSSEVKLGAKLERLEFRRRVATEAELKAAEQKAAGPADPKDMEWVYARELLGMKDIPLTQKVPLHAMRIGGLGIVGLAGEVFTEIGLDIKKRSPMSQTMIIGIANGSVGYVATDKALDEGSYETRLCRHVRSPKGTGKLWADTAVRLLAELKSK